MAGVSDVGFRDIASFFGADGTVTEMLSARAMAHNPKKAELMTITSPNEKVKIAQIFGHEIEFLKRAAQDPLLQKFDGLDINMGCPAPKIVKNGEGAALMDDLLLASKIVEAVKMSAGGRPVSVKFRKGNKKENFLEFAQMCADSGADFVTFHARTVAQGYSGKADLDAIASVKAKISIPVIGNGDVTDLESLQKMKETGVDGVMVGRGSLGKPWIFSVLKGENKEIDKIAVVRRHVEILRQHFAESWIKLYIRKHLLWYANSLFLASSLRQKLATCEDVDACLDILEKAFV